MTQEKEDIVLLNGFTTSDEAEQHRMKLENPDDFGILTIHGRGFSPDLHHVVAKKILREFMK